MPRSSTAVALALSVVVAAVLSSLPSVAAQVPSGCEKASEALLSSIATWSGASIGLNACGQECVVEQNCYNCMSANPLTDVNCICNKLSFSEDVMGCADGSGTACAGQSAIYSKYRTNFCAGKTVSTVAVATVAASSVAASSAVASAVSSTTPVTTRAATIAVVTNTTAVANTTHTTHTTQTTVTLVTASAAAAAASNTTTAAAKATTTTSAAFRSVVDFLGVVVLGVVVASMAL